MISKKIKTVVIVPIKSRSKRVKNKNFKLVNNKPLYTYLLSKLKNVTLMKYILTLTALK